MKFILCLLIGLIPLSTIRGGEKPLRQYMDKLGIEPLTEKHPPPFQLVTLTGDTVTLERFRGKVLLLHFWATWCVPCRREMPVLDAFYRQADSTVAVMGVSIDSPKDSSKIAPSVQAMNITFPIAIAFSGKISPAYWTWGIPVTYIFAPDGTLIGRARGERNWMDPRFQKLIRTLQEMSRPH
ncbi:MAG: TlpA family protein disulfide reductase [Calditrichaeota bacterium]|nr:MAG: TlpA family protein disulfide reductase [Calditrichota bacterium]